MPAKEKEYPYYLKTTVILIGLVTLTYICYILGDTLVPLAFAAFLSILLNPLCNRFMKWGIPKIAAITLTLTIAVIFVAALFYFLSTQIAQFSESLPMLKTKFISIANDLQIWVEDTFGIATKKQSSMVKDALDNAQAMLPKTVGTVLGTISVVLLLPVYMFLMLFYKTLILNFIFDVFKEENSKRVAEILKETKSAIQSYIVGLLIEMLIVAAMNSAALLILGVKYAVLIGCIGAILNLVPYLGGIVAIALPVLMATVTKDGYTTQLLVLGAYALIQFIDNNILVPRIVSSKVQINALISIIIVLLGNQLWGVSGMFLSIPVVAVLKIVFDRIDDLKPWGRLLGDTVPTRVRRFGAKPSVAEKLVEGE